MNEDLYAIGKIRRCFGVKGDLVVESMTPNAERFSKLVQVLIGQNDGGVRSYRVESARPHGGDVVIHLEGIIDRNRAEELVGAYLYVARENRIALPPYTYFVHDIIGLKVEDEEGAPIGTVVNVLRLPAQDVYVVQQRSKEYWIPSVRELIRSVDLQRRVLKIRVIEGLLQPSGLKESTGV